MAPVGKSQTKAGPVKKPSLAKGKGIGYGNGAPAKVLNTVAAWKAKYGEDMERKKISAVSGVSGASTIRKAFTKFKELGLMSTTSTHAIISDEGMEQANLESVDLGNQPTTNEEYLKQRMIDAKLTAKETLVVKYISNGSVYTKDAVLAHIQGKKNSTFRKLMTALKDKDMIEYIGSASIQLHKDLFPFGGRPE